MKKPRPRRPPTLEELKAAALICFRNAEELLADAELLHGCKRFPRAIGLTCIGTEELGKARLAFELYEVRWSFDTESKAQDFWRFWRDHQSKAAHGEGFLALDPAFLERHARHLLPDGYADWYQYEQEKRVLFGESSRATVAVREGALYVDFFDRTAEGGPAGFTLPSATIREEHCGAFVRRLREMVERLRPDFAKLGWLEVPPYPPDEYEEDLAALHQ
jgi:AbiV family abortive infection protein